MKPALIISIIVAILLLGGVGIFFATRNSSAPISPTTSSISPTSTQPNSTTPAAKLDPNSSSTFTGKLTDLFSRADSQQCTLKSSDTKNPFTGTFFVAQGRVRGEIQMTNSPMDMQVIVKDNQIYFWSQTPYPFGFQTSLEDLSSQTNSPGAAPASEALSKDQVFDCVAWTPDDAKFVLPNNIKFTSTSSLKNP